MFLHRLLRPVLDHVANLILSLPLWKWEEKRCAGCVQNLELAYCASSKEHLLAAAPKTQKQRLLKKDSRCHLEQHRRPGSVKQSFFPLQNFLIMSVSVDLINFRHQWTSLNFTSIHRCKSSTIKGMSTESDWVCRDRPGRLTDHFVSMRFVTMNPPENGDYILLSLLTGRKTFVGFDSSRVGVQPYEYSKIFIPNTRESHAHNDTYFGADVCGTLVLV